MNTANAFDAINIILEDVGYTMVSQYEKSAKSAPRPGTIAWSAHVDCYDRTIFHAWEPNGRWWAERIVPALSNEGEAWNAACKVYDDFFTSWNMECISRRAA
jgi:hypothetical protein